MRRHILFTVVAVAVLAIAAFFVPAAVAIGSRDRESQRLETQREAATAVAAIDPAHPGDVRLPDDGEHDYALYSSDGSLLTGDGPARADRAVRNALRSGDDLEDLDGQVVAAILVADDDGRGEPVVVRVAESSNEARASTANAITRLGLAAIGIAAAAGVVGWVLTIRLTRPIEALRSATARLGAGDLTTIDPTGVAELDEVILALDSAGQQIGNAMARERSFSADASHQLRTPISAMRAAIEAEQLAPRADHTTILAELLSQADRLESTVTSLLELARETHTDRTPVDLRGIITRAVTAAARRAATEGRALRWEPPNAAVRTTAAAAALGHVLDVLLDNAVAHGSGTITLTLDRIGGGACVQVCDEGRIEDRTDAIFERRSPGARNSGIGLHLARSLIEAEGGRLRLASSDPVRFEMTIPCV